ncbi:hypothetical protein [Nocardia caishijiensis]|uniref:WXG100 family type VII secretion target n=1 Tax=Nocardia caishijiensis TaxID=184756 RepID=A0ABQ6YEE3_9NOCA|nr:hypothetical protein [Nocardia caishijiensis]KAF0835771.1 hypothetical protein FNL39_11717 [Nocardia caishijiensis]
MSGQLPKIDYGQAKIGAFKEVAANGTFEYNPDGVRAIVDWYDQMIREIRAIRDSLDKAEAVSSFGGFDSAKELRAGFIWKATEGKHVLNQLINGIYEVQEGFLIAGKMTTEVDELNQRRLQHQASMMGSPS